MTIQFFSKPLFFFLCALFFISASVTGTCSADQETAPAKIFKSISPTEAYALVQERKDLFFLDVRTARERADAAIAGSQLVSMWDLMRGRLPLPKDTPILLVCAVGGRSYAAGKVLSQKGYQEVYNLSGGIKAWYKQGLPITRNNK